MGLLSRKKKTKINNALSTSMPIFWGGSSAGTTVNELTAMQTSAVYASVRVITDAVACLPINIHRYTERGREITTRHPLHRLLHHAPNPEMSSFDFRETLMLHLLIYGNAYAQIIRDGAGRVNALYPLLPNKMDVFRGEDGKLYYTYWRNADEKGGKDKSGGIAFKGDIGKAIPYTTLHSKLLNQSPMVGIISKGMAEGFSI